MPPTAIGSTVPRAAPWDAVSCCRGAFSARNEGTMPEKHAFENILCWELCGRLVSIDCPSARCTCN